MTEDATATIIKWSVIGFGVYILYEFFNNPNSPGSSIGAGINSAEDSIANLIVNLTSPAAPAVQGTVVMPNGSSFPASQLTSMNFGFTGNTATFTGSDGSTYQLSPQVNGAYTATAVD
jgi:hypothetical protein